MGSNPAWRIELHGRFARGNNSGNKCRGGLKRGQPITQHVRVLLHTILHDFSTVAHGAEMAVHALHHRVTAVPQFPCHRVDADGRTLIQGL